MHTYYVRLVIDSNPSAVADLGVRYSIRMPSVSFHGDIHTCTYSEFQTTDCAAPSNRPGRPIWIQCKYSAFSVVRRLLYQLEASAESILRRSMLVTKLTSHLSAVFPWFPRPATHTQLSSCRGGIVIVYALATLCHYHEALPGNILQDSLQTSHRLDQPFLACWRRVFGHLQSSHLLGQLFLASWRPIAVLIMTIIPLCPSPPLPLSRPR